ncbi:MAG: LmeA family phospholipid-binding protein [Waterburya sp.]
MNQPDLGEQAISKAAEIGLSTQLDEVEKLDVDIRTNPLDLMQGKLQSVEIEGEGLVMKKELRAEELNIQTNEVAINSVQAAFGNIELTHPTNAKARIVLSETDIERAFNSEYIKQKLQNLKINTQDNSVTANINQIKFGLPEARKVSLEADLTIIETKTQEKVAFTAVPSISDDGSSVTLEEVTYPEEQEYATELTSALLDSASTILNLKNFDLKEMSLRLKKLEVQPGKMILVADAEIKKFPDAN